MTLKLAKDLAEDIAKHKGMLSYSLVSVFPYFLS